MEWIQIILPWVFIIGAGFGIRYLWSRPDVKKIEGGYKKTLVDRAFQVTDIHDKYDTFPQYFNQDFIEYIFMHFTASGKLQKRDVRIYFGEANTGEKYYDIGALMPLVWPSKNFTFILVETDYQASPWTVFFSNKNVYRRIAHPKKETAEGSLSIYSESEKTPSVKKIEPFLEKYKNACIIVRDSKLAFILMGLADMTKFQESIEDIELFLKS